MKLWSNCAVNKKKDKKENHIGEMKNVKKTPGPVL